MTEEGRQRRLRLHTQNSFSPDIQGLRAVAVVLVFAYHMFPSSLPGGFVGVDVFFVISGYLITGLLLKDLARNGRIGLLAFYGRRVKRLLPAASAVLIAVGCFHWLLPASTWDGLSQQLTASALYYQNWWLGLQSVDYLGSEVAPGPLQHFWSLAVEEQYYIAWPLFFLFISLIFSRYGSRRPLALAWSVGIIFLISFAHSVLFSRANPEMAYFASSTRAWELALGGLLNFVHPGFIVRHCSLARTVGLAMILASCFLISADSLFPGYVALLPTSGTCLIIICSNLPAQNPLRLFTLRPVQYLGDVSYSLYLWHWPVIIFYTSVVSTARIVDEIFMIGLALVLADLSKRLLEDPLRRKDYLLGTRWPFLLGILCTGLSLLSAWLVYQAYLDKRNLATNSAQDGAITPSPLEATLDRPALAKLGCHTSQDESVPRACSFGNENSPIHLALVGDSHALQWSPAFREIAEANGWRFTLFTKSACTYAPVLVGVGSPARAYRECLEWRHRVREEIHRLHPSHVIFAQSRAYRIFDERNPDQNIERLAAAYEQSWQDLQERGIGVLAIRDTPRMTIDAPTCLTAPGNAPEDCFSDRAVVLDTEDRPDPLLVAAAWTPDVFVLDMSDLICDSTRCPAVSGNFLIWRDRHHLTATFVKSLKPAVAEQLAVVLEIGPIQVNQPRRTNHVSAEALAAASNDVPIVYERRCFNRPDQFPLITCEFGGTDSSRTMVLIGDSRAAQWSPALIRVAQQRNLKLVTLLNSSCPLGNLALTDRSCSNWSTAVAGWIELNRPDILVVSQSRGYRVADIPRGRPNAAALADGLSLWLDEVSPFQPVVFLVADTPRLGQNPLDCLANAAHDASLSCATRKEAALPNANRPDPLALVAKSTDRVVLLDLNDRLCPPNGDICPPLVAGYIAWRTKYLLTTKFVSSTSKVLERLILGDHDEAVSSDL